jgi:hypothetical protein
MAATSATTASKTTTRVSSSSQTTTTTSETANQALANTPRPSCGLQTDPFDEKRAHLTKNAQQHAVLVHTTSANGERRRLQKNSSMATVTSPVPPHSPSQPEKQPTPPVLPQLSRKQAIPPSPTPSVTTDALEPPTTAVPVPLSHGPPPTSTVPARAAPVPMHFDWADDATSLPTAPSTLPQDLSSLKTGHIRLFGTLRRRTR